VSSLLDILHRKDNPAEPEPVAAAPAADSAAQTVELRLAVDNGPGEAHAETAAFDTGPAEIGMAPDPAATLSATDYNAAAAATDPFATRILSAGQPQGPSRRSTLWLGASLALILAAAFAATWLLSRVRMETAADDSLFTTPAPASSPATTEAARPVERPQPASSPETPKQERARPRPVATKEGNADTDWFDTPATEEIAEAVAEPASGSISFVRGTGTNPLFPKLREAWDAFQAGDYARAETLYREVRTADAGNIDALLGLGAIAARGDRPDEARDLYEAVLLAEPKNAAAVSALSTLPAAGNRRLDESTLKNLLREQPGAANLHFALGLQYVAQGRWPDAQSAFFEAVRNEPTNADYAYNLAVSLDRLGQAGPAAAYYQRALDLANGSVLFKPDDARARLATLRPATP